MKIILLILMLVPTAFAAELRVDAFYLLNREAGARDSAAEVCFSLRPAPQKLMHVQVTVDPNTSSMAYYNTLLDNRGSACLVVSTRAGRVHVAIPGAEVTVEKSL